MRLFIAEKPSLARAIAAVLPQPQKASRLYIEAGNDVVAWAAGHLLEQAMPEQYDEKYKRWNLADLPIIPEEWKMLVKKESRDLFDNLKTLLKEAESVVNAGDCDREGQLLKEGAFWAGWRPKDEQTGLDEEGGAWSIRRQARSWRRGSRASRLS